MDNFPQELIDRICRHLEVNELKQALTVNQKFQAAAERYSGAFNEFSLDEDNAEQFLGRFSNHRFRYLRHIKFAPVLLTPERNDYDEMGSPPCRESQEDLETIDEEFTRQTNFLFSTVNELEHRVRDHGPGNLRLTIHTPIMDVDPGRFCYHRAFVSWRIHLLAPEDLPILNSIRYLRFVNGTTFSPFQQPRTALRSLDLRVILNIASKLPNLGVLSCEIGGEEWPTCITDELTAAFWHAYQGPRRDSRHDFSAALENISLPCLREVLLNFIQPSEHIELLDQREAMPNLVAPAPYDPFSSSLRILSYPLRRMCIFAVVDLTLLLPGDGSIPSWPYLESLNVKFHMASPSGRWYFKGLQDDGRIDGYELQNESAYPPLEKTSKDAEEDDEIDCVDWNCTATAQFRVMPDHDVLGPFLAAFAESTKYMPSLKEAALWCPLRFSVEEMEGFYEGYDSSEIKQEEVQDLAWGIAYTAPGNKAFSEHPGVDRSPSRQLWWKVGKCQPDSRTCELVRQIGFEQHGGELIEYWDDEFYGEGLVDRVIFESFEWRVFPDFNRDLS